MTEQQTVELARLEVVVTMTDTNATVWLHPALNKARQCVLEALAGASGEVLTSSYEKLTVQEAQSEVDDADDE